MNRQEKVLEEQLDRLVDGELSDPEYRNLLQSLEGQPDGWRRCAMAFLEAQVWGRELNAVRKDGKSSVPGTVARHWRSSWFYAGAMALACAASFLLAFSIAMRWQDRSTAVPNSPTVAVDLSNGHQPQLVSESVPYSAAPESPLGKYQLVVDSDSAQPQAVEMPVFSADDPRAGLLLDEYATGPQQLIRALESRGNQVRRERNWIPMPGNSTAPVYVPVDELQITPVSSQSFQ